MINFGVNASKQELLALSANDIRDVRGSKISMIFQEPMRSLSPLHRIGNQVSEVLTLHRNMSLVEAKKDVLAMFERVGFADVDRAYRSYPFEMSGGMRQRAMIAMAMVAKPDLLIADEPTTALDVTTQAQVLGLMKDLQFDTGMALILVTHDLGVVANMADNVVVMNKGRIMESGPAAIVLGASVQVKIGQSDLAIDHLLSHRRDVRHANLTKFALTLALWSGTLQLDVRCQLS